MNDKNEYLRTHITDEGLNGIFFSLINETEPKPTLIVVGGSTGGNIWALPEMEGEVLKFLNQGLNLFTLAYFNDVGLPKHLDRISLEYFESALRWLSNQSNVDQEKIGIYGGSKGGELALLLGSYFQQIHLVIASVPSSVIWQSINPTWEKHSSWTFHNRELPFVPYRVSPQLRDKFSEEFRKLNFSSQYEFWDSGILLELYEDSLFHPKNQKAVEEATISVEKINGPILLISGTKDHFWPSTYMCNQIEQRLNELDFNHTCQHTVLDINHYVPRHPDFNSMLFEFIDCFFHADD